MIVTRFAPSPTGYLHIGGARTALFSWLLARHGGGKFLLRIEDTDKARSDAEVTQAILDSLAWLGINFDGEPVFQSQRAERHRFYVRKLLDLGQAYWCDCSPQMLEGMREEAMAKGLKPKYDGRCREKGLGPAAGRVVRLKTPLSGEVRFTDLVKGPIAVNCEELDDMVLQRSDGSPTYNLAVTVDDAEMGVTHVLRGDDHVSNTPKQILIYRALDLPIPFFGHVPLIHGKDKHKLSKRHGARSVLEYREDGFLPEALLNYLVRLGWSHGDQEIFSVPEMTELFDPSGLSRSAASFDPDKLLWLNSEYIKKADTKRLAALLLEQSALPLGPGDLPYLEKITPLYRERSKTLQEMAEGIKFFFADDNSVTYDQMAREKFFTAETLVHLGAIADGLATLEIFSTSNLEDFFKNYIEQAQVPFKLLAQPVRLALTGKTASPGLFETMEALGRERTVARLRAAGRS